MGTLFEKATEFLGVLILSLLTFTTTYFLITNGKDPVLVAVTASLITLLGTTYYDKVKYDWVDQ